jgi:hypothetical protein
MVAIHITDASGNDVSLDDSYTTRVSTGEVIRLQQSMQNGRYVVLDDSYKSKLQKNSDNFRFTGIRNGQKVVEETFNIAADCCHINKVSGKDEVQL